jgi:hypothetical protein
MMSLSQDQALQGRYQSRNLDECKINNDELEQKGVVGV